MPGNLKKVLEKFKPRLAYKQLDLAALDISRSAAAGNLGDGDDNYAEWAMITNDPLVITNYVKTYITTLQAKLSSAPYRPENQQLAEIGIDARLDSFFTEMYGDVLNDGYAYLGVGLKDDKPFVKPIDARYVMFNGDDPTLRTSTDVVIFEILPISLDEHEDLLTPSFLTTYVDYDAKSERVRVSHYHKDKKKGIFVLDVYDEDPEKPVRVELPGLDRIPVVRFVGERVELSDKRYHYRGIYYQMASVIKAMALAGTKIQVRTAASEDANYIVRNDAIINHPDSWKNSGAKTIDNVDQNGGEIPPVQFVPHDNDFLLNVFNNWKTVISDMLGPVVQSGSEAVTREEVMARNEVRDAISNAYLSRMADSIEEVYRCIQMFKGLGTDKVVIYGGYIDSVQKKKDMEQLVNLYQFAKEGGLNTQGFVVQMLALTDIDSGTKMALAQSFQQDPFKSPQVQQLEQTVQQLNKTIQAQNQQIGLLRLQATQRLERQKEFIDSTERTKRLDLALKQWTEEQKQTQEARMSILNDCLAKGDYDGALKILQQIQMESQPIINDNIINVAANAFSDENAKSVQQALDSTNVPPAQPAQVSGPTGGVAQVGNTANVNAPMPRPAVTTFNDA